MTPCLTVLMPVYNAEKYLQEAIESILNQTLRDFEFLIIDDASTDSSVAIIKSFHDPRMRLVENDNNMGISATLNKGIELTTTELIARMDADDISYADRLQRQYEYFKKDKSCSLLSTAARVISADKKAIRIDRFRSAYYYYNLNFICWIYHSTVMFQKGIVIDVGKYTEAYSEDFDLWWKISRNHKICHLHEVLLDYRLTDESLSQVIKRKEYETAQHEQVIRNVHFYTGNKLSLSYSEVECLRHNFEPLLEENNFEAIMKFIRKLDYINHCILHKFNVNYNKDAIREAAHYKREYMINFFYSHLPKLAAIRLLWLSLSMHQVNLNYIKGVLWKILGKKYFLYIPRRHR